MKLTATCPATFLVLMVSSALLFASRAEAQDDAVRDSDEALDAARAQVEFGIEMPGQGLWREAAFRFERAAELDPGYAAAHNNLAVAYEQLGQLDAARLMYKRALALDPDNAHIEENFTRFLEIDDRRVRPVASRQPQMSNRTP